MELARKTRGGRGGALLVEVARHADFVRWSMKERGVATTVAGAGRFALAQLRYPRTAARRSSSTFGLGSAELHYELGRYNTAWLNERSVEISVARHALQGIDPADVLEIGNVLGHYGISGHTVLDKYEVVDGVVNDDLLTYRPARTFAAVVSVSTLEHIGFDEPEKDPEAPVRALAAVRGLLSDDGFAVITVPLGYNPHLDAAIRDGSFAGVRQFPLRRVNADNDWVEDRLERAVQAEYGKPYPNANAVLIALDGPGAHRVPV